MKDKVKISNNRGQVNKGFVINAVQNIKNFFINIPKFVWVLMLILALVGIILGVFSIYLNYEQNKQTSESLSLCALESSIQLNTLIDKLTATATASVSSSQQKTEIKQNDIKLASTPKSNTGCGTYVCKLNKNYTYVEMQISPINENDSCKISQLDIYIDNSRHIRIDKNHKLNSIIRLNLKNVNIIAFHFNYEGNNQNETGFIIKNSKAFKEKSFLYKIISKFMNFLNLYKEPSSMNKDFTPSNISPAPLVTPSVTPSNSLTNIPSILPSGTNSKSTNPNVTPSNTPNFIITPTVSSSSSAGNTTNFSNEILVPEGSSSLLSNNFFMKKNSTLIWDNLKVTKTGSYCAVLLLNSNISSTTNIKMTFNNITETKSLSDTITTDAPNRKCWIAASNVPIAKNRLVITTNEDLYINLLKIVMD